MLTLLVQGFFPGSRLPARAVQARAAEMALAALGRGGRPPGQPLPPAVQTRMEALFRADFSSVRVHVGMEPGALGALALTVGSNLYFAPGHYNPHTQAGQRLIGHELTHVVQQRAGRVRAAGATTGVTLVHDSGLEAEAERMAARAVARPLPAAPPAQHPATMQPFRPQAPQSHLHARRPHSPDVAQPAWGDVAAWGLAGAGAGYRAGGVFGSALGALGGLGVGGYRSYIRDVPVPRIAGENINPGVWHNLTANVPQNLRFSWGPLANHLFLRLLNSGITYHITGDGLTYILGQPNGQGNCRALATAFTAILNAFDFNAQTRAVRPAGGRFIVHAPNFFDATVGGHLYLAGTPTLIPNYFMFSNHWATWVPSLNRFYDPMAAAVYTQAYFNNTIVECDVVPDPTGVHEFISAAPPHTLNGGAHFTLDQNARLHPAGFFCYDLA
jgi:hypothetical protein